MAKASFGIICKGCTSATATKYLLPQNISYYYACTDFRTPEKQVCMTFHQHQCFNCTDYISHQDCHLLRSILQPLDFPKDSQTVTSKHCFIGNADEEYMSTLGADCIAHIVGAYIGACLRCLRTNNCRKRKHACAVLCCSLSPFIYSLFLQLQPVSAG